MKKINFQILNIENEIDLNEYEKGLYQAFVENIPDSWIIKNYLTIDFNRLRSRIPYHNQIIYLLKDNNKILSAGAFNINNKIKTQVEEIGFTIMKNNRYAEGLNFYINRKSSADLLLKTLDYFDLIIDDLKNRGITVVYGSCNDKMVKFSKILGFAIVDSILIDHEVEYLLKYEIS